MKKNILIALVLSLSMGLTACNYVYPLPQASSGDVKAVTETAVNEEKADTAEEKQETSDPETEDAGMKDKLSLGLEEGDGEESAESELTEIEEDIEAMAENTEKEPDKELSRGAELSDKSYTASDVEGYWKYDAYDNIYLALYDSGSYETYDLKTDDLLSEGTFELDGSQIEMTEKGGEDPEMLQIISLMRLQDDEGDTLSPYRPVKSSSAGSSDVTRDYENDDVEYFNLEDGNYKIRSRSRGVYIKYPTWFEADASNDFLWTSDGDMGYITARNITDDYYSYMGSDEDYIRDVAAYYLGEDFETIYGPADCSADEKFKWGENGYLGSFSVNFWNSWADIFAKTAVFFSPFDDGTYEVVLINTFYRYGDRDAAANMAMPRIGGQR